MEGEREEAKCQASTVMKDEGGQEVIKMYDFPQSQVLEAVGVGAGQG